MDITSDIGVVVIGRNEGLNLVACLQSVLRQTDNIIYVDSGSSDGSIEYAQSLGIRVINLDMSVPFNAGRARNEGFDALTQHQKELKYIQFVDGDCGLLDGWLEQGGKYLSSNASCAIAVGRLQERFPQKSIYNLLCDIEWDTPVGEVKSCGGIFLVRGSAFQKEKGFDPAVIAGEEPELCYRLRLKGWTIYRLDFPMALHDADMHCFSQWWMRNIRSGHAYAQGVFLHGQGGEQYCVRRSIRIWLWALVLPCSVMGLAFFWDPTVLLFLNIYLAQFLRIGINANKRINDWKSSFAYAMFNVIGKLPEFLGQLLFIKRKIFDKTFSIIE